MTRRGIPEVRFNLYDRNAERPTHIVLYFHYRDKRLKYYTTEKVVPDGWDFIRQRALTTRKFPEGPAINDTLNRLEYLTRKTYRENPDIDPADFRRTLDIEMGHIIPEPANQPQKITLISFIEREYQRRKESNPEARNTWKVIPLVKNQLEAYGAKAGKIPDFQDMNTIFFDAFRTFMYKNNYRINYAVKILKTLRALLAKAYETGATDSTEFQKIKKLGYIKTDEITLTPDEINRMLHFDFTDRPDLEKARDLFLIGYFTALRFSDFRDIRPEHIIDLGGIKCISKMQKKERTQVTVPILPALDTLLSRYGYNTTKGFFTEQTLNQKLKEIAQCIGMTERILIKDTQGGIERETEKVRYEMISTHTARRSYATNMIQAKVSTNLIMFALDHKTEEQTRHYARIDQLENAQALYRELHHLMNDPANAFMFEQEKK
jgi:integrase